jgi:transposase
MAEPTSCCAVPGGYCARVDTLFNLPGVHVLDVAWHEWRRKLPAGLRLLVETSPAPTGCPGCGVIVEARGRRVRRLHDIPAFGAPVELVWRQRRYRCAEPDCPVRGFSEDHDLARPRAKLTTRAAWWAISQIARDNASVQSVARRLGVDWHTVWETIKPLLEELADDPDRLIGVETVGVDEHIWHHQPRTGKGPKEQTGIVDLTRRNGRPRARLLDLVPGRSGKAYADWLRSRGNAFTAGIGTATLDPFRGYGNAIRDELEDATAVLDAFHVVRLGLKAMERPGDGSSRNCSATAVASTTRSTGSATPCGPAPTGSPPARSSESKPAFAPATPTSRSPWPGAATSNCAQRSRPTISRRARRSRPRCSTHFPPAPFLRSPASAGPFGPGENSSWPTSGPAGPTTAAPKRSTASSSSTAGSPAASAIPRTTDYG